MSARSEESNKRVVWDYFAAFNRGDLDALSALFDPEAEI